MAAKGAASSTERGFPVTWHLIPLIKECRDPTTNILSFLNIESLVSLFTSCGSLWDFRKRLVTHLQTLTHLGFSGKKMTYDRFGQFIPLCTNVRKIDLSNCNRMSHDWIGLIGRFCKRLTSIHCRNDSEPTYKELECCQELREVSFKWMMSRGSELLSLTKKLPNLTSFAATMTEESDAPVYNLAKCVNLQAVSLSSSGITDRSVACLKGLQRAKLDSKNIKNAGIQKLIENSPDLTDLELVQVGMNDEGLKALGKCTKLQRLSLWECDQVTLPGVIGVLTQNAKLEVLELVCDMNDEWLKEMAPLSSHLRTLVVWQGTVSEEACREFLKQNPNVTIEIASDSPVRVFMISPQREAYGKRLLKEAQVVIDVAEKARRLAITQSWQLALKASRVVKTSVVKALLLTPPPEEVSASKPEKDENKEKPKKANGSGSGSYASKRSRADKA